MNYWLVVFDAWIIVIRSCFQPIIVSTRPKQKAIGCKTARLGCAIFRASQPGQVAVPQEASESKPAFWMLYRSLGNTGLRVSKIGFGCELLGQEGFR
jgi:hypothetical protein